MKLGLRRRCFSDAIDVAIFIVGLLESSGVLHGYRFMYERCRANGLNVRKEDVRLLLRALDPEVNLRQRRRLHRQQYFAGGPNFIWRVDSYDKLTPFTTDE